MISNISIEILDNIKLSQSVIYIRDIGFYEKSFVIPQQNISKITLLVTAEQNNKIITKNKTIEIKLPSRKEIIIDKEMAFTCGSGVTACILGLANSIISGKKPIIYDGSWAEYGLN